MASFSLFFPAYQSHRGRKKWTIFFTPFLIASLAGPMFMMQGTVRPVVGALLLAFAAFSLFKLHRRGWKVNPEDAEAHRLSEG